MKNGIKRNKLERYQMIMGYLLILPAMILFCMFFAYSLAQSVQYSMLDWDGVTEPTFIGLKNYIALLQDKAFGQAFLNNWYYTLGIMVFGVLPGLILASILSLPDIRGRMIFRSIYFFPRIISAVVYGVVWKWIYDPRNGLLMKILDFFGYAGPSFSVLGDQKAAMLGIVITGGWTYFGFCMVIFLAALMGVDNSLKEAAVLDGADRFQSFFYVVLPQIMPVINMMIVYTVIDSFKVYDLVLVMTKGGPNEATQIMTYYIYKQAFQLDKFGYGSAAAILLGICMTIFVILYNRILEREEV